MKRFVLVAVLGSTGRALAVVIALVALAGAVYFGSHRLSNPDHYRAVAGGTCAYSIPPGIIHPINGGLPCSPPTRAVWQIPLAVLLAAVALGAVLAAGADVRSRRRPLPRLTV